MAGRFELPVTPGGKDGLAIALIDVFECHIVGDLHLDPGVVSRRRGGRVTI